MFAPATWRTYNSHLKTYMEFCDQAGIKLVPISDRDLACFAAFLANKLSYNSCKQYLNIVKLLHEEAGFPNPLCNNWLLNTVCKGMKRTLGAQCTPKLPITLDVMNKLFKLIDLSDQKELCFWCACVIAFFSFLRKSNLFPGKDSQGHFLTRGDAQFTFEGVVLHVKSSKTIQFKNRVVQIPLARAPNTVLCPAQATLLVHKLTSGVLTDPLFRYMSKAGQVCTLTYSQFLGLLKNKLCALGFNPNHYAGHSFRRGGATLALSSHIPSELVRLHGDWASEAYLKYFDPSVKTKFTLAQAMTSQIV